MLKEGAKLHPDFIRRRRRRQMMVEAVVEVTLTRGNGMRIPSRVIRQKIIGKGGSHVQIVGRTMLEFA